MKTNTIEEIDALEGLKKLKSGSVDLTVTSPPYDDLRSYNGYSFDFEPIADQLYRVTAEGGVIVWVVADGTVKGSETGTSFRQALYFMELGFRLHDTMIYQKAGMGFRPPKRYGQVFEYMFILSKGSPKTFNLLSDRPNKTAGKKTPKPLRIGRRQNGKSYRASKEQYITPEYGTGLYATAPDPLWKEHPAVFPLKLAEDHIQSWSNSEDLVLDPFAGSGTTLIACEKLGRRYIGFELSAEYVELSKRRLEWYREQAGETEAA